MVGGFPCRALLVANSAWRVGGSSNAGKFLDSMLDSIKAALVRYATTEGVTASSGGIGRVYRRGAASWSRRCSGQC